MHPQRSWYKHAIISCATIVSSRGQILPFSCISPQLTLKTIGTDTEARKQAALVFHPLSLECPVLLLHKCGQGLEGFILLQNEKPTFLLTNFCLSSLLGEITFLARRCLATTHIVCEDKKIISFTLGSVWGCIFTQLLSSEVTRTNGSLRDTNAFIHRRKKRHWRCLFHRKGLVNLQLKISLGWAFLLYYFIRLVLLWPSFNVVYKIVCLVLQYIVYPIRKSNLICVGLELKKKNSANLHQQLPSSSDLRDNPLHHI